jgi:hypothetical protein
MNDTQAVETLLRLGFSVFPVHGVVDGRCTCGESACAHAAKHPFTPRGFKDAVHDLAAYRRLCNGHATLNVAAATGQIIVVDVDPRSGGDATWGALVAELGIADAVDKTVQTITGSGGMHVLFRAPEGVHVRSRSELLGKGVDVKAEGGYIVVPPSLHISGGRYEWEAAHHPADLEIAPIPAVLLERILSARTTSNSNGNGRFHQEDTIAEGTRNDTLYRTARSLRAKGLGSDAIRAAVMAENRTKCQPPLADSEVEAIVANALRQPDAPDFEANGAAEAEAKARPWPVLDSAALHGIAGMFVNLVEPHSEADPAALLIQFLAAVGNRMGRTIYRVAEGSRHHANIYCVVVGKTGVGRKGSSWSQVARLLRLLPESTPAPTVHTGLSSGEGLIWAVRDKIERLEPVREKGRATGELEYVVVDPGVDDKRLLVLETEFSSTLRVIERDGNTLSALVRQAWDSGDLQSLTKNSPAKATGAHVSIIGHTTDEELLRSLTSTQAANGFGNRQLWVCARRSKILPRGGRLRDEDFCALVAALRNVFTWCQGRPVELSISDRAWAVWDEVYPTLTSGRPGLLGALLSRAEAQVLRLAIVYAGLDTSDTLEPVHLQAALAVWRYAEASVEYIFGDTLGDPDADAILSALCSAGGYGLSRTDIRDMFVRHLSAARIERALGVLHKANLATVEKVNTGGRPAEVWRIKKAATKAT